jgi:pre-mRNA-processing factor 40
MYDFFLC